MYGLVQDVGLAVLGQVTPPTAAEVGAEVTDELWTVFLPIVGILCGIAVIFWAYNRVAKILGRKARV